MKNAIIALLLLLAFSSYSAAAGFRIVDLQSNPSILYVGPSGTNVIISVLVKNNSAADAENITVSLELIDPKDSRVIYLASEIIESIQPEKIGTAEITLEGKELDLPAGVYTLKASLSDSEDFFEKSIAVSRIETSDAAKNVPELPLEFTALALAGVLSILYFKRFQKEVF